VRRCALIVALLVASGCLVGGCGSTGGARAAGCGLARSATGKTVATATAAATAGAWPDPNADLANTRDASGSTISSANVATLRQAWTFQLTGTAAVGVDHAGSLVGNPIVVGRTVYFQDLDSNVYAVALGTGELRWEYECNQPVRTGPGPNGVAVSEGTVYAQTSTVAFALSARTGRKLWATGHLLGNGQGTFGIQPQVAAGRVYLASQYGSGPGGGVLLALNAANGAVLWKFNTVHGREPGVQALGLGSGGAWETPLVSGNGTVTYGTGNPYQTPAAALAHPSADLYTDSDVTLDAATGRLRWYYQGVPDDFKDYDMQASPMSGTVGGVPVVVGAGKMGYVYAMNADTGRLLWKTPVGEHNGHDNDSLRALARTIRLQAPLTILPGALGGVLTNLALAGGSVYVVTCDLPLTYPKLTQPAPTEVAGAPSGEVEALDLATGRVE
jgi:alcohol dehydrogenase (cytochrome c)